MKKEETLLDCAREDREEMRQMETTMSMLICHNFRKETTLYYRGRCFEIKLLGKLNAMGIIENDEINSSDSTGR